MMLFNPQNRLYWPKANVIFVAKEKQWRATVSFTGVQKGQTRQLAVVVMGVSGQALCQYFEKVGNEKGWVGIPTLTSDIVTCASATVST
jgi:hypothetical protein